MYWLLVRVLFVNMYFMVLLTAISFGLNVLLVFVKTSVEMYIYES